MYHMLIARPYISFLNPFFRGNISKKYLRNIYLFDFKKPPFSCYLN